MMKLTDALYWTGIAGALTISSYLFLREHERIPRNNFCVTANKSSNQTIDQKIQDEQINFDTEEFTKDSPEVLLARTLYGEARSESREVKECIANTIVNRTKRQVWWGKSNYLNIADYSLKAVILKKFQYSCFNSNDPNLNELKNPQGKSWQECLSVAKNVLEGKVADKTSGSTHYHNAASNPFWAECKTPKLILQSNIGGDFKFYELER